MYRSLLAVIVGGSTGCVIRWWLSMKLNSLFPSLPPGTLVVNLVGVLLLARRWRSFCASRS